MEKIALTIELVPSTTWANNVRSAVSQSDWDKIRRVVYKRANNKCEICGGRGTKWPVECHEVWRYDEEKAVQVLVRMIALCPSCHSVKHIGRTSVAGDLESAIKHLCKVNAWSRQDAKLYIEAAFEDWSRKSRIKWNVNLDALSEFEVDVLIK